ncbi:toxin-antitoxin system HicB family antitoxin [Thermoanaerobacterium sp. PSU-2]|uniref:toxin-antitoxin system HicB family antitoxin n=1 Tax=Thermoanaerobacterium sp. PSU-2 TaxID=1930849 RepID=UPI0014390801|nr:toxin-antitoxin system HicB family antitoxin [Thermoanaerobacterium sp. PSU-2]
MNSKYKRNQTTLRIPAEIDAKITSIAQKMGISKNAYILMLISQTLKDYDQSETA